jgi:superfamily II DNA helicase RecQ
MLKTITKKLRFGLEKENYILKRTDINRSEIFIALLPLQHAIISSLDLQFVLPRLFVKVKYDEFSDNNISRKKQGLPLILENRIPSGLSEAEAAAIIPKTIIYCDRIAQCLEIQHNLRNIFHGNPSRIEVFHGGLNNRKRTWLQQDFESPSSYIRIMICTNVLGMGTDIAGVKRIVQWRQPVDDIISL